MTLKSNWQLLWLLIGLKMSRQFFQWEAKPKPMGPCTRDFSRALRKLSQVAVRIQIGSSRCLLPLWLVGVITLVLLIHNYCLETKTGKNQPWVDIIFDSEKSLISTWDKRAWKRNTHRSPKTFRTSAPLKSWIFQASIRNCKNCVHNCKGHSLLDSTSAVQYMICFIYNFIAT